jgi:myosin heavy subunit
MASFKPDFTPVEDMTTLFDLTEQSLLQNLEMRYKLKHIYTYTGSILVSVNPYELLPLYTPNVVREYFGKQRGSLPPHIFAIADSAYTSMTEENKNQSVIIAGESGAGILYFPNSLPYVSAHNYTHSITT